MKTNLSYYLNEETSEVAFEELEEVNAIGAGNVVGYTAPLGASGVGSNSKLEKGFWRGKAGKKVKTASPRVHDSDALALQEMPHVEYNDYEPKDFEVEKLNISQEEKRRILNAFRNTGVLCHGPDGQWMVCTLDNVRKATKAEIADESIPHLEVTLEYEHDIQESFGAMHKPDFKGPAMPGLWKGLENPNKPVKTGSPELDKDMEEMT